MAHSQITYMYVAIYVHVIITSTHSAEYIVGGTDVGLDSPQVKTFTWFVMSFSKENLEDKWPHKILGPVFLKVLHITLHRLMIEAKEELHSQWPTTCI